MFPQPRTREEATEAALTYGVEHGTEDVCLVVSRNWLDSENFSKARYPNLVYYNHRFFPGSIFFPDLRNKIASARVLHARDFQSLMLYRYKSKNKPNKPSQLEGLHDNVWDLFLKELCFGLLVSSFLYYLHALLMIAIYLFYLKAIFNWFSELPKDSSSDLFVLMEKFLQFCYLFIIIFQFKFIEYLCTLYINIFRYCLSFFRISQPNFRSAMKKVITDISNTLEREGYWINFVETKRAGVSYIQFTRVPRNAIVNAAGPRLEECFLRSMAWEEQPYKPEHWLPVEGNWKRIKGNCRVLSNAVMCRGFCNNKTVHGIKKGNTLSLPNGTVWCPLGLPPPHVNIASSVNITGYEIKLIRKEGYFFGKTTTTNRAVALVEGNEMIIMYYPLLNYPSDDCLLQIDSETKDMVKYEFLKTNSQHISKKHY